MSKIKNKIKIIAIFMALLIISLPVALAEELNLVYDGVGNLKSGDSLVRTYDGFNHLVRIQNDSGDILQEMVWHPQEDRVFIKKIYNSSGDVAQRIVYVNENTVKIKNSSGTFYEHYLLQDGVIVSQIDTDGNKQAIHPDILSSANVVTDSNGNILETNFVSPFGEPITGGKETRFDYTGKEYDETTKLHDFKARQYKSEWGRFLQVDPIFFNINDKFVFERQVAYYDPQLLNPYSYTRNNPYKFVDEDGNFITLAAALTAVIVAIAVVGTAIFVIDSGQYAAKVWRGEATTKDAYNYYSSAALNLIGAWTRPAVAAVTTIADFAKSKIVDFLDEEEEDNVKIDCKATKCMPGEDPNIQVYTVVEEEDEEGTPGTGTGDSGSPGDWSYGDPPLYCNDYPDATFCQ
jgi:RHS repeat-associated protein